LFGLSADPVRNFQHNRNDHLQSDFWERSPKLAVSVVVNSSPRFWKLAQTVLRQSDWRCGWISPLTQKLSIWFSHRQKQRTLK
jgi:hypothetical protein